MKFYIGSGLKNSELVNNISAKLQKYGWIHTYNWAENINGDETKQDLINYSILEKKGIEDADVVIIILPAGRGTHIELGMSIALNKKIYLYSNNEEEFCIDNTVAFYELPSIIKLVGDLNKSIEKIINLENDDGNYKI